MADNTGIEWADATWNPTTGCTKVSAGCDNCYAETLAERFRGTPGHYFEHGFDVQMRPDKLDQPLRWKRPRRIFVNSMSDLFHDQVPDWYVATVFAVMALAPQHTFQVLTKRHARMRSLLTSKTRYNEQGGYVPGFDAMVRNAAANMRNNARRADWPDVDKTPWPLPNVWLGVSAEDQRWADIRIPVLLDTPAAVRFVSAEPLLGPIDLLGTVDRPGPATIRNDQPGIDWVIVGGESGRGARPMHPVWARALRDECTSAGVAFLFKQWGEWAPQWPSDWLPGDVAMAVDGTAHRIGAGGLDELSVEVRRRSYLIRRVGKKTAGRVLGGRTWDEYPEVKR